METVSSRFLRYCQINSQSDESSSGSPSSAGQLDLARILLQEMQALGLSDLTLDERGYLLGVLPSNTSTPVPAIGFIAHMDTSPDCSGENVQPKIVEAYDGYPIVLDETAGIVLTPDEFPELANYIGKTLITGNGTTLLGADDKAGIAEILTALEFLLLHPEIPHGKISIAFTPDEEIGRGADHFDVTAFGADWAYTVDGGAIGELEYENFNAAEARLTISGRNIHPGSAKNKMKNALHIAMEFNQLLPAHERPEHTEGYEGFFHLHQMAGTVEKASLSYLIRDHDRAVFEKRKEQMKQTAGFLNRKYGDTTVTLDIKDQYYNMKEMIQPVMQVVQIAEKAMLEAGVPPVIRPIRGGTDGARLSYMNLPCPNLFTGGHNFHGKYEFIPVESMEKAVEVLVNIARLTASPDEIY